MEGERVVHVDLFTVDLRTVLLTEPDLHSIKLTPHTLASPMLPDPELCSSLKGLVISTRGYGTVPKSGCGTSMGSSEVKERIHIPVVKNSDIFIDDDKDNNDDDDDDDDCYIGFAFFCGPTAWYCIGYNQLGVMKSEKAPCGGGHERPVPGSLSSLLHLHNRQRQPMPASMPGTLPNPTMPGSSAVLMPMERQMSMNSNIMGMQGPNLNNPCASPQVPPMHSEAKMALPEFDTDRKTSESPGPGELAALGLEGPMMSSHVATGDTVIASLGITLG
ncbi:hypothetical protein DUI87_18341 [Hirundo rustica rustica]|uniref:Uncharacterized protein n=1 Tax=Hirundo rustica rustica TaxID=333673 RepID=A0A3M0KD88_HIRRU|nr:hypothetical protein DUI87_18341 [Hirundo rustica rustica]